MSESQLQLPIYTLEPDGIGGTKDFRVYNFEGGQTDHSEWFIPHRKNHYLLVFVRKAEATQWIDTVPYALQDNSIYISRPDQIIVKTESKNLFTTGIAFTEAFLMLQEIQALNKLPLLQNPFNIHELRLTNDEASFVEDLLSKINFEYRLQSEWQQRMIGALLNLLLTYLSRIYSDRFQLADLSSDKVLLREFRMKVELFFRDLREVADYASLLNISAGHLSELVKAQSGIPAIKHIHERLMLEAKRLLFHTDNSLKEIAFELGFGDASYFNRFFKRENGLTPGEYRIRTRKMYH